MSENFLIISLTHDIQTFAIDFFDEPANAHLIL